jgi:hypothetical protein
LGLFAAGVLSVLFVLVLVLLFGLLVELFEVVVLVGAGFAWGVDSVGGSDGGCPVFDG